MKTFFGGVFIDKNELKRNGIEYPIKLEYYKIVTNTEENIEKYGIEIVKTEYKENNINIEGKEVEGLTYNEKVADDVLKIFKENEVTPIGCDDILEDLFK